MGSEEQTEEIADQPTIYFQRQREMVTWQWHKITQRAFLFFCLSGEQGARRQFYYLSSRERQNAIIRKSKDCHKRQ